MDTDKETFIYVVGKTIFDFIFMVLGYFFMKILVLRFVFLYCFWGLNFASDFDSHCFWKSKFWRSSKSKSNNRNPDLMHDKKKPTSKSNSASKFAVKLTNSMLNPINVFVFHWFLNFVFPTFVSNASFKGSATTNKKIMTLVSPSVTWAISHFWKDLLHFWKNATNFWILQVLIASKKWLFLLQFYLYFIESHREVIYGFSKTTPTHFQQIGAI